MIAAVTTAYLVVVALLAGSFVNLAMDRVPRGESVIRPRSHCRGCGRQLNIVDLLPVAGWIVRGGRCATCGSPIGVTSPIVESACGALMLGPALALGLWPGALVGAAAVATFGLVAVRAARGRPVRAER